MRIFFPLTTGLRYKLAELRFQVFTWPKRVRNRFSNNDFSDKTILMVASSRGGSTWLAESFAQLPGFRTIWEPLRSFSMCPPYDPALAYPIPHQWAHLQPLFPSTENRLAREFYSRLLHRRLVNRRSMRGVRPAGIRFYTDPYVLIKTTFAPLQLEWFCEAFPAYKVVYLVRHPGAVLASRLKHLRELQQPDAPYTLELPPQMPHRKEYLEKWGSVMEEIQTMYDAHVFWTLLHLQPLRSEYNNQRWITVHYEEMIQRPGEVFENVCKRLAIPAVTGKAVDFNRPSTTTNPEKQAGLDVQNQLAGWRKKLTLAQQERLGHFMAQMNERHYTLDRDAPQIA